MIHFFIYSRYQGRTHAFIKKYSIYQLFIISFSEYYDISKYLFA